MVDKERSIFASFIKFLLVVMVIAGMPACATLGNFLNMLSIGNAFAQNIGPFQASYVWGLENPEIVVKNDANIPVTIKMSGPAASKMTVKPKSSKTMTVKPGSYTYNATGPNVQATSGKASFESNYRYTWQFYIQTVRQ